MAYPASAVCAIATRPIEEDDRKGATTRALVVVAFYFLLRVGEYTPAPGRRRRRTVPLRRCDVKFRRTGKVIPLDSPLETLLEADVVTLCLENQKNGIKGYVLHHGKTNDSVMCPVRAMARVIHEGRGLGPKTPIGTYVVGGSANQVTAKDIRSILRQGAIDDALESSGYDLSRIGSHSLRSGGAVALKLAGHNSDTIKKLG